MNCLTNKEKNSLLLEYALLNRDNSSRLWLFLAMKFGNKSRIRTVYDDCTVYTVYQFFGKMYAV